MILDSHYNSKAIKLNNKGNLKQAIKSKTSIISRTSKENT